MANAQLSKKVCFWYNGTSGAILTGMPEEYSAPRGFEKIVCNTAHEAEMWSERQRKYEAFKESLKQEERELVEGPIRDNIRSEILHQIANARNSINRDFLKRHLEEYDKKQDPWKWKRESYLHAEAFEKGH
jgi:hypothetical protein